MAFQDPIYLLCALGALVLVGALLYVSEKREGIFRRAFRTASFIPSRPSLLLHGLILLLLFVAVSRPTAGHEDLSVGGVGRDIMVALDVSLSMEATDNPPSRLEFAKAKLLDLVRLLRDSGRTDRIGIVLFAGHGYLFVPLTDDYGVLQYYINSITTELLTSRGSGLADALTVSAESMKTVKAAAPRILLLTDGEDESFEASALDTSLRDIPIYVIGFGTEKGSHIPQKGGGFIRDDRREVVTSRLQREPLKQIAALSGGGYRDASLVDSDLEELLFQEATSLASFAEAKGFELTENGTAIRVYKELGPYLIWVALMLLFLLSLTRRERITFR